MNDPKSIRFRAQLEFAVVSSNNMIGNAYVNAQEFLPEEINEKISKLNAAIHDVHQSLRKLNND